MTGNDIFTLSALFFLSLFFGFFAGLYFELFRFIRLAFPHRTVFVVLEDLLFFLPVSLLFVLFTFCFSLGVVRWFSVAGVFLGFFLYLKTLGKLLLFFSNAILSAIRAFLRFVFRKILLPVFNLLKRICEKLFTSCKKCVKMAKIAINRRRSRQSVKQFLASSKKGFSK